MVLIPTCLLPQHAFAISYKGSTVEATSDFIGPVGQTSPNLVTGTTVDATEALSLAGTEAVRGWKNFALNGNFRFWHKGDSHTDTTNDVQYKGPDVWATVHAGSSAGQSTISKQTFTLGQTDVPGEPEFFYRHDQTVGTNVGSHPKLLHRVENVRVCAGQTCTISFYAKANASFSIDTALDQYFGTGGSGTVDGSHKTHNLSTSWQRYTHTVTPPGITGKTTGPKSYLEIDFEFPDNATFTVDIAGVQLEAGSVATAREQRPYALEKTLIERFFWRIDFELKQFFLVGQAVGAGDVRFFHFFSTEMACVPSLNFNGNFKITNTTWSTETSGPLELWGANTRFAFIRVLAGSAGLSAGDASTLLADAGSYFEYDCQL